MQIYSRTIFVSLLNTNQEPGHGVMVKFLLKILKIIHKVIVELIVCLIPVKKWQTTARHYLKFRLIKYLYLPGIIAYLSEILITNKTYENYLSVLACTKNEGDYLEEWIEYHRLLGVDKFFIYDNESDDNTYEVLKPYIDSGIVDYEFFEGKHVQTEMYKHGITKAKHKTRWLATIDIDEFIQPLKHKNIVEFLKEYEKYSEVSIYWMFYGSSGHIEKQDGLTIENFLFRDKFPGIMVKSIYNPRLAVVFISNLVHYLFVYGKSVNEKKEIFKDFNVKNPTCDEIRVNHYYCKSREEFFNKKAKRGSNVNEEYCLTSFQVHDRNDIFDDSMLKYAGEIKKRLGKMDNMQDYRLQ
jgi:hypothetical protein